MLIFFVVVEYLLLLKCYGWHVLVMEKVEGTLLSEWVAKPHSKAHRDDVATHLQDAISQMHASGYVHGDLRGENIVVSST
jgi:tRNA A-37 threonylcarbamoyl transferase component Bud32